MVLVSKDSWMQYVQRITEVSKHREASGRFGGPTRPVTPAHQQLYFQALNAIGCHNEHWFRKFKISIFHQLLGLLMVDIVTDLIAPLPAVSSNPEIAAQAVHVDEAAVSTGGRTDPAP